MSYQVFTDVTADMNDEMISYSPALHLIPMNVNLGDRDYLYGPGGNLDIRDFYTQQRGGKYASTSQITPYTYLECFEPVLAAGTDILYLCFTSGLSSTYQTAKNTTAELQKKYPERRITLIDTLCAAVGEGFLVYEAMKKYEEGLGIDELAAWVEAHKMEVCHWFTVDTFDHLLHGGRVSATSAKLGSLLNIKPLLHVDNEGKLEVSGKPRGQKMAMRQQLGKMKQGWMPEISRFVLIGHADCPEKAEQLKGQVLELYPDAEVQTAYIGPVIGAHVGPGMVALIYWGNNR